PDHGLRAIATTAGNTVTYTCVPPGSGMRAGVDRDEDGFLDRDELDAGRDPADPTSFPGSEAVLAPTKALTLQDGNSDSRKKVTFESSTKGAPAAARIVPPAAGSTGDPTAGAAVLTVYNSAVLTNDVVVVELPASGWSRIGKGTPTGWRFKGTDPAGPIATVVVKADSITIKGGKAAWTYSLDEPAQGRVAVRLRLALPDALCAHAPARARGA